jgi:hypothetical protein
MSASRNLLGLTNYTNILILYQLETMAPEHISLERECYASCHKIGLQRIKRGVSHDKKGYRMGVD